MSSKQIYSNWDSTVVNYNCKMLIRLTIGHNSIEQFKLVKIFLFIFVILRSILQQS